MGESGLGFPRNLPYNKPHTLGANSQPDDLATFSRHIIVDPSESGLLSDQGEKRYKLVFTMVPLRKIFKYGTPKPRNTSGPLLALGHLKACLKPKKPKMIGFLRMASVYNSF